MRHKTTGMRHKLDNLISQQIGFYGRNTITFDTFHPIEGLYQIKEGLSGGLSEIADVDSGQHYFLSAFGGSLPGLFSGALITETLFGIPGIGLTSYNAMVGGDIPFSMFYLTFLAILTLLGNLISDVLYAVVDPRVRIA